MYLPTLKWGDKSSMWGGKFNPIMGATKYIGVIIGCL